MTCHTKIHVFPSRRSVKNCTCLHLLHANVRLKTRGVEGLLPKLRAFLTNLHVHYINNLSAKYTVYRVYSVSLCTDIAFKVVFILHRNNVSLQTNIFFEPYLDDICAIVYRRYMNPKAALYSATYCMQIFVNSHRLIYTLI